MIHTVLAKLDKRGSELAKCYHYTVGNPKGDISGGIYIKKTIEIPPDFIEIEIPQRKGDENEGT
jgi:hypothetical protein